jgi:hypothetical protein
LDRNCQIPPWPILVGPTQSKQRYFPGCATGSLSKSKFILPQLARRWNHSYSTVLGAIEVNSSLSRWITSSSSCFREARVEYYVRSLTVNPLNLDIYFTSYDTHRKVDVPAPRRSWISYVPLLAKLTPRRTTKLIEPSEPVPDHFETFSTCLTDTLVHLSSVKEFTVEWPIGVNHSRSVLMMAHIWTSLGSNLSTLTWKSSVNTFRLLLLESPSVHFPVLEELTLGLHGQCDPCHLERFHHSIGSFLHRHSFTITSLSFIGALLQEAPIDIAPILTKLGHFVRLRQLGLTMGIFSSRYIQVSMPQAVAHFLDDHVDTLESLSIRFITTCRSYVATQHEVDDTLQDMLRFRNGHSVTVLQMHLPAYKNIPLLNCAVLNIAPRFSKTLTAFVVSGYCETRFIYDEVVTLVNPFSHQSADTGLKLLELPIDVLSPQLVDFLAFSLPGLKKLTLSCRRIHTRKYCSHFKHGKCCGDPPDVTESVLDDHNERESFNCRMEDRVYDNWALRHIVVRPLYPLSRAEFAARAIAECIPDRQHMLIGEPPVSMVGGEVSAVCVGSDF